MRHGLTKKIFFFCSLSVCTLVDFSASLCITEGTDEVVILSSCLFSQSFLKFDML